MGAIALRATKSFAPIRNNVQPVGFALPMTDKIESHYQWLFRIYGGKCTGKYKMLIDRRLKPNT
jgi:hypothetical protein